MKILETERLLLRELTADDAAFILEMLNEPAFIRNVADRGVRTVAEAQAYIVEKLAPGYAERGLGFYLVELKKSGTAVGICGLVKREAMDDVDIGYSTLERFWGRGYAFEAAAALMRHGNDVLGIPRIVGVTAPGNLISIKLLEKLGLRFERMVDLPGFEGPSALYG